METKHDALQKRKLGRNPVALSEWANWCGDKAPEIRTAITERRMGGMADLSPMNIYNALFG